MCVSTAKVSAPKAQFMTTLAVFRPTPGSVCNSSRSAGTSPSYWSTSIWLSAMTFFALLLKRPMVLMCRSEEHTFELQSLMRISYAVFCLQKKQSNVIHQFNHLHPDSMFHQNSH